MLEASDGSSGGWTQRLLGKEVAGKSGRVGSGGVFGVECVRAGEEDREGRPRVEGGVRGSVDGVGEEDEVQVNSVRVLI